MREAEVAVFIVGSILVVTAGFGIIVLALRYRAKVLEMTHRERMAMIERGLLPPPERDPLRVIESQHGRRRHSTTSQRRLSFGIAMIGWGVGIAILFSFAFGVPGVGVGFGGAFVVIGAAMIVTALVTREENETKPPPVAPASSAGPESIE
jgi:hypothetical protein